MIAAVTVMVGCGGSGGNVSAFCHAANVAEPHLIRALHKTASEGSPKLSKVLRDTGQVAAYFKGLVSYAPSAYQSDIKSLATMADNIGGQKAAPLVNLQTVKRHYLRAMDQIQGSVAWRETQTLAAKYHGLQMFGKRG